LEFVTVQNDNIVVWGPFCLLLHGNFLMSISKSDEISVEEVGPSYLGVEFQTSSGSGNSRGTYAMY
jgi:hypothetical protein